MKKRRPAMSKKVNFETLTPEEQEKVEQNRKERLYDFLRGLGRYLYSAQCQVFRLEQLIALAPPRMANELSALKRNQSAQIQRLMITLPPDLRQALRQDLRAEEIQAFCNIMDQMDEHSDKILELEDDILAFLKMRIDSGNSIS
jgi:DNA-directed RNA polymerase specialized sigma24 family protein